MWRSFKENEGGRSFLRKASYKTFLISSNDRLYWEGKPPGMRNNLQKKPRQGSSLMRGGKD